MTAKGLSVNALYLDIFERDWIDSSEYGKGLPMELATFSDMSLK